MNTTVTEQNFMKCLAVIAGMEEVSLDTEGYGLRVYHGDTFFSIIMGNLDNSYYFNFHKYPDHENAPVLGQSYLDYLNRFIFSMEKYWILHNAKYDMSVLRHQGIELKGFIHCTMTTERVINSEIMGHDFSLAKTAKRYGLGKDDAVEAYIQEHKLFDKVKVPGKQTQDTLKHFELVPFSLIVPYGHTDQRVTHEISNLQREAIRSLDSKVPCGGSKPSDVFLNEGRLLKTVSRMEHRGVSVDTEFCERAIIHEGNRIASACARFEEITGRAFSDSRKLYEEVFHDEKDKWVLGAPTAVKGERNPKFDKDVLATFKNPAAACILEIHEAKALESQYLGLLYHVDDKGRIHANFNQHVARTGRFSSSKPNLQNMKKDDDDSLAAKEFAVRRAIKPKEGHFLGMIDYDQMEYRLLLNYCNATGLIEKIKEEGLDVHQATASLAGTTRKQAKNVNFGIVYGQGDKSLADSLGTTLQAARDIKKSVDRAAPEIGQFKAKAEKIARTRGHIYTWDGRKLSYPPYFCKRKRKTTTDDYKSVNGLIQGGCAGVIKKAMPMIERFLDGYKTKMIMQIHDELIFEGPIGEEHILNNIKNIMEKAYKAKRLTLTAGIDISYKSLADKEAYVG